MGWTILYGSLLAVAMFLAWLSESVSYQKFGLLMLASWVFYNAIVRLVGWDSGVWSSTLFSAMFDAILASVMGAIALKHRSYVGWSVVVLFAVEEVAHVLATIIGAEHAYYYHGLLNAIFALQVVTIGGAAGARLANRRPVSHFVRPFAHGSSG